MSRHIFRRVRLVTVGRLGIERAFLIGLTCALSVAATTVAGNGIGAIFNLGAVNTVNATTTLSGSAAGASLRVRNRTNAPALDLRVPAGTAPMKVNSATKVEFLNADSIDGLDSSELQRPLLGGCSQSGSALRYIAADGAIACDATAALVDQRLTAVEEDFVSRFATNPDASSNEVSASNLGTCMVGEVRLFAGSFAPVDWTFTYGQLFAVSQWPDLFSVLGYRYGGGKTTFALPDTQDIDPAGMHHIICINGAMPSDGP